MHLDVYQAVYMILTQFLSIFENLFASYGSYLAISPDAKTASK
jgi:hypothetical protein